MFLLYTLNVINYHFTALQNQPHLSLKLSSVYFHRPKLLTPLFEQ
jgi:hypothetical protein